MMRTEAIGATGRDDEGVAAVLIKWLRLAAAPSCAIMALSTAALDHGLPNVICPAAAGSWLSGMAPMYSLMAIFHSAPWLKLVSRSDRATFFARLDRSGDVQTMEQKPCS
jgi:hypothetical protein